MSGAERVESLNFASGIHVNDGLAKCDWPAAPVPIGGRSLSLLEPLSYREVEVAGLVAHGFTNEEIGQVLFISSSTSKFHVTRIVHKLQAGNRVELAVWAWQVGLAAQTSVTDMVRNARRQ